MKFTRPLVTGKLIKRYKRFLADVTLDSGEEVTAHCTSTGALLGIADPGSNVWLSPSDNPNRKLAYTWEMVESEGVLVGVNTSHPNLLVAEAISNQVITELQGYEAMKREVKYGTNSRIDILLSEGVRPNCYVEVKNVHLKRGGRAEFPDAVTSRGTKHLEEMMQMVKDGHRAAMVYVIQRDDCEGFGLAKDIDPVYAATAATAIAVGVEIYAYECQMSPEGIVISKPVIPQM